MSCAEDSQKAKVVFGFESAAGDTIDGIAYEGFGLERSLAGEGHGLGGSLVTDPVADPVGVAGPLGFGRKGLVWG